DEYGGLLTNILAIRAEAEESGKRYPITGMALSSVVPELTGTFRDLGRTYFSVEPLIVGPGIRTEMAIKYDDPRTIGADRIVNAVAASHLYPVPQVIIDFGTAVTFCAVTRDREYRGGAIFPGIHTSFASLAEKAALISMVEFRNPGRIIGRNTEESLQSGAINGYASLVEGMVNRFKAEIGDDAVTIGTGGMIEIIAEATDVIRYVDQDLTLKGLKILYNLNKDRLNSRKPEQV
ncbi:MAG TPA: type III pantothenate kinase, partial [Firmicutes bacterium]|nr:type III pantothenate kinase [Bacillota bacterium]